MHNELFELHRTQRRGFMRFFGLAFLWNTFLTLAGLAALLYACIMLYGWGMKSFGGHRSASEMAVVRYIAANELDAKLISCTPIENDEKNSHFCAVRIQDGNKTMMALYCTGFNLGEESTCSKRNE